jgi:hypothetical protein
VGTKNNPDEFDCYANAEPDEPMFVLLARDPTAPSLLRWWVRMRKGFGKHSAEQDAQALAIADAMEAWREENRVDAAAETPSNLISDGQAKQEDYAEHRRAYREMVETELGYTGTSPEERGEIGTKVMP